MLGMWGIVRGMTSDRLTVAQCAVMLGISAESWTVAVRVGSAPAPCGREPAGPGLPNGYRWWCRELVEHFRDHRPGRGVKRDRTFEHEHALETHGIDLGPVPNPHRRAARV